MLCKFPKENCLIAKDGRLVVTSEGLSLLLADQLTKYSVKIIQGIILVYMQLNCQI